MQSAVALLLCLVAAATASFAVFPYHHYPVYHGYGHGYGHDFGHGYDFNAVAHHSHFYFLGTYGGSCGADYDYGFYHTGYAGAEGADSFIVCDHGRAFRFSCPAGTVNSGDFKARSSYGMNDICTAHA